MAKGPPTNNNNNGPFSSAIEENKGYTDKSPFVFPFIMLATALFLGTIVTLLDVEGRLNHWLGSQSVKLLTSLGAISITFAHGHSMATLGNARRYYEVPHPVTAPHTNIGFWNGNRGYYNLTEHLPFFLLNVFLCQQVNLDNIAGLAGLVWGVGRVLYTHGYASQGPSGRTGGFMISTMSSMACLGAALIEHGRTMLLE